jgi:hypothetical protein
MCQMRAIKRLAVSSDTRRHRHFGDVSELATSRIFVAQQHHDHDSVIIRASNEHNSVAISIQLITVDADLSLLGHRSICAGQWITVTNEAAALPVRRRLRFIAIIWCHGRKHGGYYGARNSSLAAGRADPDHYLACVDLALTGGSERSWQR